MLYKYFFHTFTILVFLNCSSIIRNYNHLNENDMSGIYHGRKKILSSGIPQSCTIDFTHTPPLAKIKGFIRKGTSHNKDYFYIDTLSAHKDSYAQTTVVNNNTDSTYYYTNNKNEIFVIRGRRTEVYKEKDKIYCEYLSLFNGNSKFKVEIIKKK